MSPASSGQSHIELDHAALLDLVHRGNVDAVRSYFDQSPMGRDVTRPVWAHLRAAVEAYNVPMAKLLATWGAKPSQSDLQSLINARGDKAVKDILCLRLAGLNLNTQELQQPQPQEAVNSNQALQAQPLSQSPSKPALDAHNVPVEWQLVLKAMQSRGAPEAIIAGGALRDLSNQRAIKDVDIFLADRFMTKRFIKKVFAAAGLTIHDQIVSGGYGSIAKKMTRSTADAFNTVTKSMRRDSYGAIFESKKVKEGAEAWTIIAGPNKTEYNIVFIKGGIGSDMKRDLASGGSSAPTLLEQFDIGLCQIAYDGKKIITLKPFEDDFNNKTLTLTRPNHSTKAHLERIVKKYPDFALCKNAQELLDPPKPTPAKPAKKTTRVVSGYGQVSRKASSYTLVSTSYNHVSRKTTKSTTVTPSPADSTGFTRSSPSDSTGFTRRGGWSGY